MAVKNDSKRKDDDVDPVKLLRRLYRCKPYITTEQGKMLEERMGDGIFTVGRRLALAVLDKDGKWFKSISDGDRKQAIAMHCAADEIREHTKRMRELVGWMEKAELSVMLALFARDDYARIKAKAEREPLIRLVDDHAAGATHA